MKVPTAEHARQPAVQPTARSSCSAQRAVVHRSRAAQPYAEPMPDEPSPSDAGGAPGTILSRPWLAWSVLPLLLVIAAWLRLGGLDQPPVLNMDESYSALATDRPVGGLIDHVRLTDPHPPLFYLLLKPVLALSTATTALRLPSALCSLATVVVLAVWRRRDRVEMLVVTAIAAVQPFALAYARQARMYGLMQLLGLVAAVGAERWLSGGGSRRWALTAAVAGTMAAFTHSTGALVLAGLAVVPGLRRDRAAWEWRGAVLAGSALFAATWGATMVGWRSSSLNPPLSVESFSITINEMIAAVPDNRILTLPLLVAGVAFVVARRTGGRIDPLGRTLVALVVLPLVLVVIVSLRTPTFIPKTLVTFTWAVPVALGALVVAAGRRRLIAGAAIGALMIVLMVPAIGPSLDRDRNARVLAEVPLITRLLGVLSDGDVVAVRPHANDTDWYVINSAKARPAPELALAGATTVRWGDAELSGRVWLVEWYTLRPSLDLPYQECAPSFESEERRVRCLLVPLAGGG